MKRLLFLSFLFFLVKIYAQENLVYQKPSQEILDIADVPLAPSVLIDTYDQYMILLYRDAYKTIAELSEEELRIGGLRINPKTNIGSRTNYVNNIKIKSLGRKDATAQQVTGLPENPRLSNFSWSPDEKKIALTHTAKQGVEVWVIDIQNAAARKITDAQVNANLGNVINWFEDSQHLLVKMLSKNRKKHHQQCPNYSHRSYHLNK